ncbi:MAG: undecaprenyl/decaprenyl-phosphate alpha-N-acetylglucosaminyl 1-phosphate transferase [Actinobacteria bacterium]|nr:MAG: undecaprenyl/decaprenyl-phosphate alpha-N-acetylglucosaminyl 1-phosphate transferase [Actinomycetota bacterium]
MVLDELRANPEVLYGAAVAFGVVVLLTPAVGGMARLLGAVDRPDARRLNRRPIPRLGGLAIFLGIVVPSLAFLNLSDETRGVLLGAAVATVVGAVDDFRGLSPPTKLAGQVAAAAIPISFGVWIDHFTFPFLGAVDLPAWIGMPLSILWIVAVMNMVNFLDGSRSPSGRRTQRSCRRSSPAAVSASSATTSSRRASSWVTPERSASGSSSLPSRSRVC